MFKQKNRMTLATLLFCGFFIQTSASAELTSLETTDVTFYQLDKAWIEVSGTLDIATLYIQHHHKNTNVERTIHIPVTIESDSSTLSADLARDGVLSLQIDHLQGKTLSSLLKMDPENKTATFKNSNVPIFFGITASTGSFENAEGITLVGLEPRLGIGFERVETLLSVLPGSIASEDPGLAYITYSDRETVDTISLLTVLTIGL